MKYWFSNHCTYYLGECHSILSCKLSQISWVIHFSDIGVFWWSVWFPKARATKNYMDWISNGSGLSPNLMSISQSCVLSGIFAHHLVWFSITLADDREYASQSEILLPWHKLQKLKFSTAMLPPHIVCWSIFGCRQIKRFKKRHLRYDCEYANDRLSYSIWWNTHNINIMSMSKTISASPLQLGIITNSINGGLWTVSI